ncbi:MAG: hypothetical protein P4K83_03335 [Terracidiphilus sp.]|nr:hypothetical protein [Terracidiphilus sp.]
MSLLEFFLTVMLGLLFWRRKLHKRFPAMGSYMALKVAAVPVLFLLLNGDRLVRAQAWLIAYFFVFWATYIASAVILFFVCVEIFRAALAGFTGLARIGSIVFRWAAVVSLIVSFSTVSFAHRGILVIADIAFSLMRSMSVLELCLLAFLALSMNALHIPLRSIAFGFSLGFGLNSASDFILASIVSRNVSLVSPIQFVYEALGLLTLGVWITYCILPEKERKPVLIEARSPIYRWNEIASALGHTGTRVAVQQPANSFFLTDVEKVVERVVERNLKSRESES